MKKQRIKLFMLFCTFLSVIGIHAETINKVEYWFDSGFESRVQISYSSSDVIIKDVITTSVNEGIHVVHYRALDGAGLWSVVQSQIFYKLPATIIGPELSESEYWFDNDFVNRSSNSISGTNLILSDPINIGTLSDGIHHFNVRGKDELGKWSVVQSQIFYKIPATISGLELSEYEYWIDNDFANRSNNSISGTNLILSNPINIGTLSDGIHHFNVRAKDESGKWSVVQSQIFYKLSATISGLELTEYEYWFDNDFANRSSNSISGTNLILSNPINIGTLSDGIHHINVRVKDETGKWSVVQSQIFYKSNISFINNKIDAYRYWFDDNFLSVNNNSISEPINPYELIANLDVEESFGIGETHRINFQFRDVIGNWSIVETDTFDIALFTDNKSLSGEMNVYPNPFENFIVIKDNKFSGNNLVFIYNTMGVCIYDKIIDFSSGFAKIEFKSDLASGIYLVRIQNETEIRNLKIKRK